MSISEIGPTPPANVISSTGVGLYYPYINIRNPHWLKASLLYWDHIGSIYPGPGTPNWRQSPEYFDERSRDETDADKTRRKNNREIAVAGSLIDAIPPKDYLEGAADRFINQMLPSLLSYAPLDFQTWQRAEYEVFGDDQYYPNEWGTLHIDKLDPTLYQMLNEGGLAQFIDQEVVTTRGIADGYMIALATEISERTQIPALTDQHSLANIGEYMKFGRVFKVIDEREAIHNSPPPVPSILYRLGLPFPGPQDLEHIPMQDIVDFHKDAQYTRLRKEFRNAVETILKAATDQDDLLSQANVLREKKEYIEAILAGQKQALDELGVVTTRSILSIAMPGLATAGYTALTAIGIMIGQPYISIFGGAGVAATMVSCYAEWRGKRRDLLTKTPWHYKLTVNDQFPAYGSGR